MKKILIKSNKDYPFTVYDENETPCHGVEVEGPCKISKKESDGSIWVQTEAKVIKLINILKQLLIQFKEEIKEIKSEKP